MNGEWERAVASHMTWARAGGTSPNTLRLRGHYLRRLADRTAAGPFAVTIDDLAEYVGTAHWSPETRKSARSAVRTFYGWAYDTGRVPKDPSRLLPPVRVPAGKARPTPDAIARRALMRADPRARLMIYLALYAGLRRGEIARVHSHDVYGDELRVKGKGGRVRMIPIHPKIAAAIEDIPEGHFFPGKIDGHLSEDRVGHILTRLLEPGWTGHTLRHSFASKAYAVERDLVAVQELLGHSKPETTRRYTQVPNGAMRAAVMGVTA